MSSIKPLRFIFVLFLSFGSLFFADPARASETAVCDTHQVNGGDQAFLMNLNTPLEFGGTVYNGNIYVSPKGTVTFGQGDFTFWDYPQTPSISIASWDYHAFPNEEIPGVWSPGWGLGQDLYVRYGSTETSICVDWKVLPWGQSSGNPVYIRLIAEVNPVNYTWTPTYQVSSTAPAGARYGVRYVQGGPVQPLEIQTITEPPPPAPVVPPAPEPTPGPSPEPTPEPTNPVVPEPEPTPTPTEPPVVEPTPEPTPTPTPSEPVPVEPVVPPTNPVEPEPEPVRPVEPEPETLPEPTEPEQPETPIVEPEPEPSPEPPIEEPIEPSLPEEEPEVNEEISLQELDLVDPAELSDAQVDQLFDAALEVFETAEQGSEEYLEALEALMIVAQADDLELPAELAAIPLLGDVAGLALEVFNNLGNVGADMSPQVRETAQDMVVVSVVVAQIVGVSTISAMSSTSIRRP